MSGFLQSKSKQKKGKKNKQTKGVTKSCPGSCETETMLICTLLWKEVDQISFVLEMSLEKKKKKQSP